MLQCQTRHLCLNSFSRNTKDKNYNVKLPLPQYPLLVSNQLRDIAEEHRDTETQHIVTHPQRGTSYCNDLALCDWIATNLQIPIETDL